MPWSSSGGKEAETTPTQEEDRGTAGPVHQSRGKQVLVEKERRKWQDYKPGRTGAGHQQLKRKGVRLGTGPAEGRTGDETSLAIDADASDVVSASAGISQQIMGRLSVQAQAAINGEAATLMYENMLKPVQYEAVSLSTGMLLYAWICVYDANEQIH